MGSGASRSVIQREILILGLAAGAAIWWWSSRKEMQSPGPVSTGGGGFFDAGYILDEVAGVIGMVRTSNMRGLDASLLNNKNVQAMLRVIRTGEGTADAGGYSRLYGGGTFASYADHPRLSVTRWGITSTAAGAYQFLSSSWDETRDVMGLRDFSPASQDLAAVGRIAARGALNDVLRGDFRAAVKKLNREWASLPESPYNQRTMSWEQAGQVFLASGGVRSDSVVV